MPLQPPNRRKAFIVNLAGGWLGNSVLIIQGLVFIPLYINELGAELYGFWLATGGVLAWFAMVDVGAANVTQQRCAAAYGRNDLQGVVDYFWHGLAVMLLVGVFYTALILLFASRITEWIGVPPEQEALVTGCFLLSASGTFSYLFSLVFRGFCSGLQRNEVHSAANLLGGIVAIAVIYFTLVHLDWGLWAIPAGNLARQFFELVTNAAYSAYLLHRIETKPCWRKETFRDYRKTTTALLAAKASGNFASSLPNILLTRFIGPEATVMHSVTMRPLQILGAFINQANNSLFSTFSHFNNDSSVRSERYRNLGRKVALFYGGGISLAMLGYSLINKPFISIWVGSEQFAGQPFTALTAVASFLVYKNNLFGNLTNATGQITKASWLYTIESISKSVGIYIGIRFGGLIGIPIAIILTAVPFQFPTYRILMSQNATFARELSLTNWVWCILLALTLASMFYY